MVTQHYINERQKLSVIGICGHEYKINFECFKNKKQYICNSCEERIRFESVKNIFHTHGLYLLENKYLNTYGKMRCVDEEGYKYCISLSDLCGKKNRKSIATKFNVANPYTVENIKLWISQNNKSFYLYSNDFSGVVDSNLLFKCKKCGEIWNAQWSSVYHMSSGCPYCNGKRVSISKSLGFLFPELLCEWDYEMNNRTPFEFLPRSGKKVWWICQQCGHRWSAIIINRTKVHTGCPACSMSGIAKKIYFLLNKYNFSFNIEQEFDDLVSERGVNLRYDFSISKNGDIAYLIEYDDLQHFKFIPHFYKNESEFIYRIGNDKIKTEYAQINHIPLKRITYMEKNNIDAILSDISIELCRKEEC